MKGLQPWGMVFEPKSVYHLGLLTENFTFYDTNHVKMFDDILIFNTFRLYIPFKNSRTLDKITLVSIWFRTVLTQIISRAYKDSIVLT